MANIRLAVSHPAGRPPASCPVQPDTVHCHTRTVAVQKLTVGSGDVNWPAWREFFSNPFRASDLRTRVITEADAQFANRDAQPDAFLLDDETRLNARPGDPPWGQVIVRQWRFLQAEYLSRAFPETEIIQAAWPVPNAEGKWPDEAFYHPASWIGVYCFPEYEGEPLPDYEARCRVKMGLVKAHGRCLVVGDRAGVGPNKARRFITPDEMAVARRIAEEFGSFLVLDVTPDAATAKSNPEYVAGYVGWWESIQGVLA